MILFLTLIKDNMQELGVGKSSEKHILNMLEIITSSQKGWYKKGFESVGGLSKRLGISEDTIYCIFIELIKVAIPLKISLSDIEEVLRHMIQEHTHPSKKLETPQELSDRLRLTMEAIDHISFGIWRILYGLLSNSGCGVWEPNLDAFTNNDKA